MRPGSCLPALPAATALTLALACALASAPAPAAQGATGTTSSSASLDFVLNIGKFIFFRIGSAAFPTASATVDTVNFNLAPRIGPGAVAPVNGNAIGVNWNALAPGVVVTSGNATLPVEVRSNAGPITIRAAVVTPLASGVNTIALSQISVTSSDANLPAPAVPNAGLGTAVNVTGTAFSNLVTQRAANWTFSYAPVTLPVAGNYTGQISFTASAP